MQKQYPTLGFIEAMKSILKRGRRRRGGRNEGPAASSTRR
jgi:hypothetical protein